MHTTLEVPVDSLAAAEIAAPFAERLELCDDLASEGWSPSIELVRSIRAITRTGLVAMIRPRTPDAVRELVPAAFRATPAVMEASLREIDAYAKAGADSVAIGVLDGDGHVDVSACTRLRDAALQHGLVVAFLRTIDLATDRARAMRDLTALRFTRVVTAGVRGWDASVRTLPERVALIAEDIRVTREEAKRLGCDPVEVVPGGGVRASNARAWLAVSPHLHASCRRGAHIDRDEVIALRTAMQRAAQ
jgi:copper homeostasis protein